MLRLFLFATTLSFLSCNGNEPKTDTAAQTQQETTAPTNAAASSTAVEPSTTPATTLEVGGLKTGVVNPAVTLSIDAAQSFALYLPKSFSPTAKLPALIFFDPHGDGSLPLNLYKDLAEKYNYILIGSNNSKNLVPFEETAVFANNLVSEAQNRFHADNSQIAVAGFSGGAKVAMHCGESNPVITKVIYCGAELDMKPTHGVTILGFAGTKDMNYTDLVAYERSLNNPMIQHYLVEWNGKHEFPTADVFQDAFIFLTTGTVPNYAGKQATITQEKVDQELTIKREYIDAFQKKDITWWKSEIASLNEKKKTDPMYDRLLGFVSLACYSMGNTALHHNDLDFTGKVITIYQMADPGNKDCDTLNLNYGLAKSGHPYKYQ